MYGSNHGNPGCSGAALVSCLLEGKPCVRTTSQKSMTCSVPKHGSESYRNRINFLRRSRQLAQAEMLASRSYWLIHS